MADASTRWKVVHFGGGFSLAVPKTWSVIPDKSTPGVVLNAFDRRQAAANIGLGVQVTVIPGAPSPLTTFAARLLASVRRQPVVGAVEERRVRLSAGPARLLRYRVHVQPEDQIVNDYAVAVAGKNEVLAFLAPYPKAKAYQAIFARSAASFRSHASR